MHRWLHQPRRRRRLGRAVAASLLATIAPLAGEGLPSDGLRGEWLGATRVTSTGSASAR